MYVHYSDTLPTTANRVHVDTLKDAVGWRHGGGIATLPFQQGETGVEVPFHNSIIGTFMVYQDRLETNLLQLFGHPENSE